MRQLADLNLFHDDQGNVEISLARARSVLAELDDKAGMHEPGGQIQYVDLLIIEAADRLRIRNGVAIPMVLYCPKCSTQHIDSPGPGWTNPPHRSHSCQKEGCGTIWRPSDLPTTGVAAITTKGKEDNWIPVPPLDRLAQIVEPHNCVGPPCNICDPDPHPERYDRVQVYDPRKHDERAG